jgi:glycosyltransferase involved in cell wall biosynthesis
MPESKFNEQKGPLHSSDLPLASIIITSYNYEKFLPRAIDSALQQTYPVKEIIVVDDGSTDNSRHIINSYGDQIIPVFQKNKGRAFATNAGFFASQGEIIFFLDADDIFFPHKVETMVNYFLQVVPHNPEVMIFHRVEMITDDGIFLRVKPER